VFAYLEFLDFSTTRVMADLLLGNNASLGAARPSEHLSGWWATSMSPPSPAWVVGLSWVQSLETGWAQGGLCGLANPSAIGHVDVDVRPP
jgi:hypothetical protein